MAKIITFFYVLKNTFISPAWYKDLLSVKRSFSYKYFFFFFFLYSLVGTAIFSLRTIPKVSQYLVKLPSQIESLYPSELEITIKNGEVSTNVKEPYQIPLSVFEKAFSDSVLGDNTYGDIKYILVIDTSAKTDIDTFLSYQTAALVTKKSLSMLDKDGAIKTIPFDSSLNVVINKDNYSQLVQKISPYFRYVVPILITFTFLGMFIFVPSGYLFYLLFFALVLRLFSKIIKPEISYAKSYQIGLHLSTIHVVLFGLLGLVNIYLPIPFLRTILFLIYSYFILKKIPTPVVPEIPVVKTK